VKEQAARERYVVRDLIVDVDGATVWRKGERIPLPPRTFQLLVALARRYPSTVRRHELLEMVWPEECVNDQTLSHRVMVLRKALGDHAEEPLYISGERGFGYRLLGPVDRLGAGSGPATARFWPRRRWLVVTAVATSTVVLATLVLSNRAGHLGAERAGPVTLAVRPQLGVSGTAQPVAGELAKAITSALRRFRGVRVVTWGGKDGKPQLWLEGACGGTTERMQLQIRLVEAATGRAVWTHRLDGSAYEILDQDAAIALVVANAVRQRVAPGSRALAPVEMPPHLRRLCIRGELAWLSWTRDGLERAEEAWDAALAAQPRHAPAHAGLALSEAVLSLLGHRPPPEARRRALDHAGRALELDPDLPASQFAAGLVKLLFEWDVAGAEPLVRAGSLADPEDLKGAMALALVLQAQGRLEASERVLDAACLDDLQSAGAHYLRGQGLQMAARWEEAASAYARALELEPGLAPARQARAECLACAGREAEALTALGEPAGHGGADPRAQLLEAWRARCRSGPPHEEAVRACLLAGSRLRALTALVKDAEERWPYVLFVPHHAMLGPLRDDPAYGALLSRLGPRGAG
jgi:DNA-binding winged helix-turn-helix (wHTH) protein/tetratricopeptide (TPR) repeat protein